MITFYRWYLFLSLFHSKIAFGIEAIDPLFLEAAAGDALALQTLEKLAYGTHFPIDLSEEIKQKARERYALLPQRFVRRTQVSLQQLYGGNQKNKNNTLFNEYLLKAIDLITTSLKEPSFSFTTLNQYLIDLRLTLFNDSLSKNSKERIAPNEFVINKSLIPKLGAFWQTPIVPEQYPIYLKLIPDDLKNLIGYNSVAMNLFNKYKKLEKAHYDIKLKGDSKSSCYLHFIPFSLEEYLYESTLETLSAEGSIALLSHNQQGQKYNTQEVDSLIQFSQKYLEKNIFYDLRTTLHFAFLQQQEITIKINQHELLYVILETKIKQSSQELTYFQTAFITDNNLSALLKQTLTTPSLEENHVIPPAYIVKHTPNARITEYNQEREKAFTKIITWDKSLGLDELKNIDFPGLCG